MSRRTLRMVTLALTVFVSVAVALPADAASLERGDRSNLVTHLQRRLAEHGFYRGPIDGAYGPQTAQAVMAFHKHLGLERTFIWASDDWGYLDDFDPVPHQGAIGIEVDLDRQVLYYHQADGEVAILPVSSANGEQYAGRNGRPSIARTPTGEFRFQRHIPELRVSYLGGLWKPWYFHGGYAIHGSSSVPAYPASHGCIRVPNWEADWLSTDLEIGLPVSIGFGEGAPQLPPPTQSQPIDRDELASMIS